MAKKKARRNPSTRACESCGKSYHPRAKACPKCGAANPTHEGSPRKRGRAKGARGRQSAGALEAAVKFVEQAGSIKARQGRDGQNRADQGAVKVPLRTAFAWLVTCAVVGAVNPAIGQTRDLVVNSDSSTYDSHPSTAIAPDGRTWIAWHAWQQGREQILARSILTQVKMQTCLDSELCQEHEGAVAAMDRIEQIRGM